MSRRFAIFSIVVLCFCNLVWANKLGPEAAKSNLDSARKEWKGLYEGLYRQWSRGKNIDYAKKKWRADLNGDGELETLVASYAVEDGPSATMLFKIYDHRSRLILKRDCGDYTPILFADIDSGYPGKEMLVSLPVTGDEEGIIYDTLTRRIIAVFGWNKASGKYKKYFTYQTFKRYPMNETSDKGDYEEVNVYFKLEQFDEFLEHSIALGSRDVMGNLLKQATKEKPDNSLRSGSPSPYTVYKNCRFGFEITYPNKGIVEYSQNGDGLSYVSRDSQLKMRANASFFPDDEIKGVYSKNTVRVRRESKGRRSYQVLGVLYHYSNNGKTGSILLVHEKNIYYTVILEAPSSVYNKLHKSVFAKIIQDYKIIDGIENS